jgi:hypothetical protein
LRGALEDFILGEARPLLTADAHELRTSLLHFALLGVADGIEHGIGSANDLHRQAGGEHSFSKTRLRNIDGLAQNTALLATIGVNLGEGLCLAQPNVSLDRNLTNGFNDLILAERGRAFRNDGRTGSMSGTASFSASMASSIVKGSATTHRQNSSLSNPALQY